MRGSLKFKSIFLVLLLFLLFSSWQVNAETVNANLSQAQLSPEVEYVNGLIKLKDLGQIFTNSWYSISWFPGWGWFPNFIHNEQFYYYYYSPVPLGLPNSPNWGLSNFSPPIEQASMHSVLTADGVLTLKVGSYTYTTSGVLRYAESQKYGSPPAWLIKYSNGSLKLVIFYNTFFKEVIINISDITDLVPASFHGFFLVKSNGELWAINFESNLNYYYIQPNAGCSVNIDANPIDVIPCRKTDINNVVKVVPSRSSVSALLSDGTVMCWGLYEYCGINDSSGNLSSVPQIVKVNSSTYLTNVVNISANYNAFSAITSNNELYVWGLKNSSGSKYNYATLKTPPANFSKFLYSSGGGAYLAITDISSSGNPVILTLLSNGQVYDPVSGSVISTSNQYLPPPLKQLLFGNAKVDIPVGNGKAVTSLSSDLQGNVKFLFSVDGGSTWYKYSSGAFILASAFDYTQANSYSEVTAIPESVWKNFTKNKNSLKVAVFLQSGSPEPQVSSISANISELITVSDITCDQLNVYPGQIVNCGATIQKDPSFSGTLTTTWQILKSNGSNGGEIVNTSNNGDIYTATIRPIGADTPKTVKVNACVGSTCVSKTQELIVQSLQAPQISLNCPTSLYVGQSGDCVATIQLPEGLPSYITPVINWNATTGTQLTPSENTASVLPVTETDKTVTVKVSYNYAPDVFSQQSANIQVLKTEITGSLNCPTEAYKGQVITCTLQYQSTRDGLDVQWLTPVESLSEDEKTAQIKVSSNTVTVKVFVTEYPSLYKTFTANLTMKTPPKPIVNVSATNSSGNTVYVSIPVTLKGTVICPEGLTCSHEWYINDELQQIAELEFSKTFSQSGRQKVSLVAWVNEVEQRELVTSRFDYQLFVYDYPRLYMYAMVDKKYATVGDTVTLTAVDTSKTDYSSIFPIKVSWILPDGSTVEGKTATYTVKESDIDPENAVKKVVIFNYQYEGIPESLKSGSITLVMLPPYRLPDFDIKLYTPQEGPVPHLVFAMPKALEKFLPGYQYNISYEWSIPELGITGNKKYFVAEIPEIGNFTLSLRVSDTLGNSVEKEVPITVVEPLPWTVDFKPYLSNKYKVAPLSVIIKPILSGGHPRDKMVSYSWYIDGQEVSNRSLLGVVFNEPGTYVISFSATSKFGNVVTGEYSIEVIPNQPPVCSLSNKVYSGTKTLYITASCTDPDGRIVDYTWQVNNGEEFKGGSKISVKYDTEPITVTLRVTDTGGNVTEVTETFSVPQ